MKECPHARNPATVEANKKRFEAQKKKLQALKRGSPPGQQPQQPQQPKGQVTKELYAERPSDLSKTPPAKGESHKQLINARVHFWCGKGGEHCYWNPTHKTRDHAKWDKKRKELEQQEAAAQDTVQAHTALLPSVAFLEQAFSSWK